MLSFLERFENCKRPWLMIDGRLYTLTEQSADGWVEMGSERFFLEKTGTLTSLERKRLDNSGEELRLAIGAKTRRLTPEQALRVKLPDDATPQMIVEKGVPQAYAKLMFEHDDVYLSSRPKAPIRRTTKAISDKKVLRRAIKAVTGARGGLASLADQAYRLRPVRSAPNLVVENGKRRRYRLESLGSSDELVAFHDRAIKEIVAQDRGNLERLLEEETRAYNKLMRRILSEKRDHEMVIEKYEEKYVVSVTSQPFAIEHSERYYLFGGFTMTYMIDYDGDRWCFIGEPRIKRPYRYRHPFVFSDNSICFKDGSANNRWEAAGITFDRWIEFSGRPSEAALKLAYPAYEGLKMLHQGFSNKAHPVHHISQMEMSKNRPKGVHIYESIDKRRDRGRT